MVIYMTLICCTIKSHVQGSKDEILNIVEIETLSPIINLSEKDLDLSQEAQKQVVILDPSLRMEQLAEYSKKQAITIRNSDKAWVLEISSNSNSQHKADMILTT